MADLSRIGVLRATASMGDLHSRGQLPSPLSYSSPIAAAAASANTTTSTTNNSSSSSTSLGFTLSTNPPAPRATAFRQGDWMCTVPGCVAHNFGRNSVCIGCGWPRGHHLGGGGPTIAAAFGGGILGGGVSAGGGGSGGGSSTNMNIGPRGGMGIGLGVAYPSAPVGGARPGVGNGIPRFAAASTPDPTPTTDMNGLESAMGSLSLHPSAVQALGGPGGLNALHAAILAHQHQQQQTRGVVDRPKVPHATIHGTSGKDVAAAAAALNALQGLPGVGPGSTSNGMPLLIPTTIAGSGNTPVAPSTLPTTATATAPTQGFSTLQQQLPQLQQKHQQQQNDVLQTLTHHLSAATTPLPSLLTPSGRQIAQGGSVRNVSGDDGNPIFMFWPDNEPLPEPGQCRPPGLLTGFGNGNGNGNGGIACGPLPVLLPPILNTGNKGPIESQPGDWTCRKCEYLVSRFSCGVIACDWVRQTARAWSEER
jgi:hypothetical protein